MWLTVVCVRESVREQLPVTWVVRHIRSQRCENCSVVSFNLPIRLWVIRHCKIVLGGHGFADVQKELRREASTVVSYALRRWTVIENPRVDETLSNHRGRDTFHWYCLGNLT